MDEKFIGMFREVLENDEKTLMPGDKFRDFEEWSSLAYLALIAMIDSEYGVVIEAKDFKQLVTVGEVYDEIIRRTA
ncbi:MAG: acyl carrier protein [Bacteroidetes bacterium]|nr:MAG: acyl carrier protein [Bacteroidota bacterium]